MDTSSEYINMCRKAKELQEMWEPMQGDFFILYDEIECIGNFSEDLYPIDWREEFPVSKKNCTWLPRIDQLITLLNKAQNEELHDVGKRFSKCSELDTLGSIFHNCAVGDYYDKETFTVEQLFLVELYDTKYNKSWDGEDWI